ncbi:MAG TPA: DUF5977 domain-containing protein [Prolixibacteraceae bacterium]|nr:DUF5977 domain-containing protein [Prolixibacteraceae bacterium]
MKLKNFFYSFLIFIFAVSCNEQIIESEALTQEQPQTTNLKAGIIGTLFVSPNGSNSNPGTESQPFLTFAYAASKANPGDVVVFENGIYKGTPGNYMAILSKSGTSSAYITFKARNKGGAILDGQNNSAISAFHINGSYISISGFEIRGFSASAIDVYAPSNYTAFSDLNIHDIGRYCIPDADDNGRDAIYISQAQNLTIERCLIHDIGRFSPSEGCSTSTVGYQVLDHGIYVNGVTNILIKNNVFYNMQRGSSVQTYSGENKTTTGFTFVNNTCENGNPYQQWGHVVLWGNTTNVLIANNIFKDHLAYAIRVYKGSYTYSNITITKNITSGGNGITLLTDVAGVVNTNNYNSTDPLFTNEATHDYSLKSNSPAAASGYATGCSTDYLNNTRTIVNIGAYGSGSSATAPTAATVPIAPTALKYYNTLTSATAVKNSCETGYTGSNVTYIVAANKYSSIVSQANADSMATADLTTNKQMYANENGTCTIIPTSVYYNVKITGTAWKNDCGTGYIGSPINYVVSENTYTSTISQADANAKATAYVDANKQRNANTYGSCSLITKATYYSTQVSGTATKNSCGTGYTGSTVTYTVVANKYSSTVSQEDANAKASADLIGNKQTYANENGTCTIVPTSVYYNVKITRTATKNDCGTGYVGSKVNYAVSANTYTSTISQADADAKAITYVDANKQRNANTYGYCRSIK